MPVDVLAQDLVKLARQLEAKCRLLDDIRKAFREHGWSAECLTDESIVGTIQCTLYDLTVTNGRIEHNRLIDELKHI